MRDIIFKFLFREIFPFSISSIVYYLFFIGLTLIILNLKYKNKSSSNLSESKNKKWESKKIIDFLKIFFTIILIYLVIRFIVLFLIHIFIPVNHISLYGY